jgi:hypothetical protein
LTASKMNRVRINMGRKRFANAYTSALAESLSRTPVTPQGQFIQPTLPAIASPLQAELAFPG